MISSLSSASPAPLRTSTDTVPDPVPSTVPNTVQAPQRATGSAAAAVESTVVNLSQPGSSLKTVLDYLPADANQDGQVGELERRAYDLLHPSLAVKTYEAIGAGSAAKSA